MRVTRRAHFAGLMKRKETMKKMTVATMLICSAHALRAVAGSPAPTGASPSPSFDGVSIFRVSLQCPAAPRIGCGSASKPVLLALEREPAVAEAWLNRAGTLLAVVWKSQPDARARQRVASRIENAGCCAMEGAASELQGLARDEALKNFHASRGWYRGTDVDRLSEEEAGIIAARLVRRVQAKTALAETQRQRLQEALTSALKKCLTETGSEKLPVRQIAGNLLDENQLRILQEAVAKGMRPLANEN